MHQYPIDIAFTPSVKAIQSAKGSRSNYERMELGGGWETAVTPELESFLADLDMFYLGTANAEVLFPVFNKSIGCDAKSLNSTVGRPSDREQAVLLLHEGSI